MSDSAGGRPCTLLYAWMKAKYWPCVSVKFGVALGIDIRAAFGSSGPPLSGGPLNLRYRVTLTDAERTELRAFLAGGQQPARKLKRAQILLAADAGQSDEAIAATVQVGTSTIFRTKRRFVEGNLELALAEAKRPGAPRKLSEREVALLVATTCSKAPAGQARWTLQLLADEMVLLTKHE